MTTSIAFLAGGGLSTAARLGLAMLALQASIGALNDLVDAPADRIVKPAKPISAGVVGRPLAIFTVVVGLIVGLALAAGSGPTTVVIAVIGVGAGYTYDLRLKGSVWGPAAFAVGVPLLPVFAWVGVTGTLPTPFVGLVPAAVLAGLGLALANAMADEEADRLTGISTAVTRLGRPVAWRLHLVAIVGGLSVAGAALLAFGGTGPGLVLVASGGAIIAAGIAMTGADRSTRRRHGWEIEALGIGVLAAGWLITLRFVS
ncbi:MAG: UbiA family prenyltransferase [Chloroflexota bacterium]